MTPTAGRETVPAETVPPMSKTPHTPHPPAPPPAPPAGADAAAMPEDAAADALVPPDEPVVHRPDGWYWTAPDGHQDFGPFESLEAALADLHATEPDGIEPGESLREAEAELGIADFIDPDTGEPAEGLSNPHLPRDD